MIILFGAFVVIASTLGGFIMARLGRIPITGETVEADDWRYEVVDMDGRRVDKVLVTALPKKPPAGESENSKQQENS